jgi:antibiotic biosynthesis monooxygenase (ABM) superfamily enzyme
MNRKIIASLKIWLVIYPSITLFLSVFGGLLAMLPLYVRTLVLTLALVPWMVFVGLPLLDVALERLFFKNKKV